MPINIGEIESFIGDMAIKEGWLISPISNILKNKKVAVVGSGPAGLTAATFLARYGASITIYEKHEKPGGILRYGIPDFRLDKNLLDKELHKILNLDIAIKYGKTLGKDISLNELCDKYDAVFLGMGSKSSKYIDVPGINKAGVYAGDELLEYNIHPNYDKKKVIVCGGGNVALDVARTIKKKGAELVTIVYRKNEDVMSAEKKEIAYAKSEGISFIFNTNVIEIIGNRNVQSLKCIRTIFENNEVRNIKNTEFELPADFIIMAIGSIPEQDLLNELGLDLTKNGYIKVDENNKTSRNGVFAGGDIVGERATVAWAAHSGKKAAMSIMSMLNNEQKRKK